MYLVFTITKGLITLRPGKDQSVINVGRWFIFATELFDPYNVAGNVQLGLTLQETLRRRTRAQLNLNNNIK